MKKRRKFNCRAICSTENYEASHHAHLTMLREKHAHFNEMVVNGEITFDTPIFKSEKPIQKYKTVRIWGKDIRVTIEEYNIHYAHLGL